MAATKAKMEQAAEAKETKKATAKAAGVKVTVIQTFYDKQLKTVKHAGDAYEVDKARATELASLKLVEM